MAADLCVPLTDREIHLLTQSGVRLDEGTVFLLEHPDAFLAHFFRHKLRAFEAFHLRLIEAATLHGRALILFPAAHGKTTIVSTGLPVWRLARDPDIRISGILKNDADATSAMRAVQAELQDNRELIDAFGPFKPPKGSDKSWALGKIEVAHRTLRDIRGTLEVYGSGGNVYGHRADWVFCDDVVTDKNSSTPEQRAKTREWFNLAVETMPEDDDDALTVVGTRFHPEDLYGDLIELVDVDTGEHLWHVQHEDAIVDDDARVTLWPGRWSWERLQGQKQKMGTLDFNKRYRNIAVDPSRMVFREEYVKGGYVGTEKYPGCLDWDHKVGDVTHATAVFGGFDPAVGLTKGHSFCVYTVLGVGACDLHERCWWLIDLERDTMSLPKQADLMLEMHDRYQLVAARTETNAYQGGLKQVVEERMARAGVRYRIDGHFTDATKKISTEIGVQAMGPIVERGELHIPWADPYSRRRMQPLVSELVDYPGRYDDCVMSLWIAWLCGRDSLPRFQSFNRITKPIQVGRGRIGLGRRFVQNPFYEDLTSRG